MKQLPILSLMLLAATLVLPTATAQANVTIELEAHDGPFRFTQAGETTANPTLTVAKGANVTVNLTNMGTAPHDFWVNITGQPHTEIVAATMSANVTFTAPNEDVTVDYWCSIHPTDMRGSFVIGNGTAADDGDGGNGNGDGNGNGGGDNGTPAPSAMVVVMGLAVLALAFRRRG